MAMTPQEEATYALNFGVDRSDLSPAAQTEYDQLAERHRQARQERREEESRKLEETVRLLSATTWFPELGVAVRDGNVYRHGVAGNGALSPLQALRERKGEEVHLLGLLAGARVEAVAGKIGKRRSGGQRTADSVAAVTLLGPVGLLAAASRAGAGVAVVTFADGSSSPGIMLTDPPSLTRAQAAAARFNALAAAAAPAEASQDGVAAELERLAALHASGGLDDEEFRAAKARIIRS